MALVYIWCVLFLFPALHASQKDAKSLSAEQSSDLVLMDPIKDDNFMVCSSKLPTVLIRLIASYCIGSKIDGVCPLLVRALARNRVIAHYPRSKNPSKFVINSRDEDYNSMMLCDYQSNDKFPFIHAFNFDTGEVTLQNYTTTSNAREVHTSLPYNGMFTWWSWDEEQPTRDIVFTKYVEHILPHHTARAPEECRLHLGEYWSLLTAHQSLGMTQRWNSSMNIALLRIPPGSLYVRWLFTNPTYELQLHPNPKESPLEIAHCWVIASDDRGCVGIVFRQQIVLFDGATGTELMRCHPPQKFSFIQGNFEQQGQCFQVRSISIPSEQKSRYELLALVERVNLMSRENRYIRWDVDEKTKAQDIQVYGGSAGHILGCHILPSGSLMTMNIDAESRLLICNPATRSTLSLWNAGWWNEFDEEELNMHASHTGSHVIFYGRSQMHKPQDTALHSLCATSLHFDPQELYESDVQGVDDSSLLQRVLLMQSLCSSALHNDKVTLTAWGKKLFSQLHSRIRCNLQTTMPYVCGWDKELAASASRKPILPILEPREKKEQKTNERCHIQ